MTADGAPVRIAIVVPCFNDGATVGDTVASALEQEPCELVVVDDGSSDPETLRVLDGLRERGIRVVRQENRGLSAARMAGVAATSAPYVYPVDADDMLVPHVLSTLADRLDAASPRVAATWGITTAFGDTDIAYHITKTLDAWRVTYKASLPYAALFRRVALLDAGGWTLDGGYEDWDLWMALAERDWEGFLVPVEALRYRVHGQRMWAEAMSRHDRIVAELHRRHPALVRQRRAAWRRSREPWRVRLLFPLIDAAPLSNRTQQRGYAFVANPRIGLKRAFARLRDARRKRRHADA